MPRERWVPEVKTSNSPTTMEGTTLTLPKVEGWSVEIGDLWNCRTSERSGENIFQKSNDSGLYLNSEKYLETLPAYDMEYTLSRIGDSKGKSEILDISVEIKLELPTFSLEGGVSFRNEDENHFKKDEFFCKYNVQTGVLRARSSTQDPGNYDEVIRDDLVKKILSGELDATHYVSEIRYGGWATGSFKVEDKMDHNLLDLSGYVGGTIPVFPGISVGLKASIGLKLQDSKENINLEIKLSAAPGNIGAPQTIEDMFFEMEKIPGAVLRTSAPFPVDGRLKGVPISMKLSPLVNLVPAVGGLGDTYKLLETEMRQELQDMLFHLNDFQGNFYKFLIVKEDRRLAVFFPTEGGGLPNPWADDVTNLQQELFTVAESLAKEADEVFKSYKMGDITLDGLRELLEEFGASIVHPSKVNEKVKGHVAEGRALLNALRTPDASLAGQPDLFIFSDSAWTQELTETPNGVFLSTHLGEGEEEIPGVLLTLYTLASKITSGLDLKVKVAVPNINVKDSKFTLYIKSAGKSAIGYSGDEILKILKLMTVPVYAKLKTHTNTSKFITALTENTKNAETWELENIDVMYQQLMETPGSIFARRRLEIADSFLETMELLATLVPTAELTFFLPAQFHVGLADTVNYFEVLMGVLQERKEPLDFVTVVGHFDTFGGTGNAPHLIVLRRDSSVAAVCFTVLDFHLLGQRLLEGTLQSENPLRPSLMGVAPLAPLKVDLGVDLWNILEGGDQRVALRDCPFILQEDVSTSPAFVLFHDVLNNVAFGKNTDVIEGLCNKLTKRDAYGGTLEAVLGKYGYSVATGFDKTKEVDWETFLDDLNAFNTNFANDQTEDPVKYFQQVLLKIVEFFVTDELQHLVGALRVLLDEYFNNNATHKDSRLREEITDTVDKFKKLDKLLQLLRFLHLSRYNANYFLLWWVLHETRQDKSIFTSTLRILEALNVLATFEEEEQQWVWSNGSFQEWVGYFLQSSSVVAKMYKLFCGDEKGGVPLWLPEDVRKVLLEIQKTLKDPHLRWKTEFQSLEELEKSLRTLVVKNSVPYNFTSVFGTNLKKSRNLLEALKAAGVLEYWEEEKGGFTCGWGVAEIKAAVEGIFQKKKQNEDVQLKKKTLGEVETSPSLRRIPGRIPQREEIFLNASWGVFTGGRFLQLFTLEDLFSFSLGDRVLPFLSLEEESLTFAGEKSLAFVFSRLREGSLEESIDPQSVATLVDYPSIPGGTNNSSFLSRSDLLTLFLNCSDEGLQFQLFQNLTRVNCSSAIPWIVQNIRRGSASSGPFMLTLSESFADLVDLKDHFAPDVVLESRLLRPPFRLVVAVRVGPFEGSLLGKSSVLNKAILKSCRFSSKEDPGGLSAGTPISRKGLVELAWLSQSTCRKEFYSSVLKPTYSNHRSEMVLLANVHGDFLKLPEEVRRLLRTTSSATFLVFWGCSSWKEMSLLRPQVKKALLGLVPEDSSAVYNLVVDPDKTIRQEVEDRDVINTHAGDFSWTWKIQRALKDLLEKSTPTLDPVAFRPTLEQELVTFVKDNSVQSIRQSLTLQNQGMFPNDLEELRKKVLEMFSALLGLPDEQQRKKILWKLHSRLQELSNDSSHSALGKMRLLSEALRSGRVTGDHLEYSSEAFRAARHELTLNSLSLGNLLRELSFQGDSANLELLLHDGFPLELINLNFFPQWDLEVENILRRLDEEKKKYGVVAVVGPQGSFKSSVLNALFSPGLLEGPFGSTNGVVLRLLRLEEGKKPPGMDDFDFLLLLDSEGFARPDNATGGGASGLLERQLGAWLLSISDLCLVFANGQDGVDWLSSLRGVLGTTCFAQTSLIEDSSGLADVILVQTSLQEENPLSLENELLQMLREVSNVTSTSPIETDAQFTSVSRLTSLYARVLAGEQALLHSFLQEEDGRVKNKSESLFQLRQKVASSVSKNWSSRRPEGKWVERAETTWESILSSEDVFRRSDAAEINLEMKVKKKVSLMKEAIENAYADHTELLEKDLPPPEVLLDFASFDGIPYLCANLEEGDDEKKCGCEEALKSLEEEEQQLAEIANPWRMELIKKELNLYAMQLRADVEAQMREERLAEELATKEPLGQLNAALKEIRADGRPDEESWVEFKGHVSSLLNVAPWWGIIAAEIEAEYGPEMFLAVKNAVEESEEDFLLSFEDDVAFDVDNLLSWGRCAFDVHGRYEDLGSKMGWEEWVWLELQVEVVVRRELVGFRRGLVRSFREEVNNLLGGGDLRGRTPPELPFTPAFLRRVHFLGLVFLVRMWEVEWRSYAEDYNPLQLLLDREGDFPDGIFLSDDA